VPIVEVEPYSLMELEPVIDVLTLIPLVEVEVDN
jgi:hypothetical protein